MTFSYAYGYREAFRLLLCLLSFVVASAVRSGQGPDIQFDEEEYDFGVVGTGDERTHVFRFRNEGDEDLIIKNVRSTCGCTTALLTEKVVPPGGAGEIEVTYRAGDTTREERPAIYVRSNDPDEATAIIRVIAMVQAGAGFIPSRVYVGDIRKDTCIRRTVKLVNTWEEELRITGIETGSDAIVATLQDTLVPPGGEAVVRIVLGPDLPEGRIDARVTLHTDNEKQPEIALPIVGNVMSVDLFPEEFFFGMVKRGSRVSRAVMISNMSGESLEILEVKTEMDPIKTSVSKIGDGRYRITAELFAQGLGPGRITGAVDVYTADRELPIEIPVQGLIE